MRSPGASALRDGAPKPGENLTFKDRIDRRAEDQLERHLEKLRRVRARVDNQPLRLIQQKQKTVALNAARNPDLFVFTTVDRNRHPVNAPAIPSNGFRE